jgi:predicted membrane metal-binding protein
MADALDDTVFAMSSVQPEHESEIARALNRSAQQGGQDAPAPPRAARVSAESARARSIAKTWPDLARSLGDQFEHLFDQYAAVNPPRNVKSNHDGFAFAAWLKSRGQFPSAARVEYAVAKVAKGFPLRFTYVPDTREAAMIFRVGGGVHVGQISLPGGRRR